jgi:hypothetical protein
MIPPMSEIHLNRRGINFIEVPEEVEATPGSDLTLHIINHGSPLHITLASTNSSIFTDFFHENLYVVGDAEFTIPIREGAYPGVFSVEVISGYGARRAEFRVVVRERAAPEPEPVEVSPRRQSRRSPPGGGPPPRPLSSAPLPWRSTGCGWLPG